MQDTVHNRRGALGLLGRVLAISALPVIDAAEAEAATLAIDEADALAINDDVAAKLERYAVIDPEAYAVEIVGDSMLPVYRSGDIVMVSPAAAVRNGDRVIVKMMDGQVMARKLERRTAKTVELASFDGRERAVSKAKDVEWIARIMWVTQ